MPVEGLHLSELKELTDDVPVTMLNLVRIRELSADGYGSGWDAYQRYSSVVVPMIKSRGGTVLWTGRAETVALGADPEPEFDFVVLVRYPSRAAFIDMMTSPEYENVANPHRINGTAAHVIISTREVYSKI